MNDTMKLLRNRKSTRVFTDKVISDEIYNEIIDSALQAPTAGNQILYSIIKISDTSLKKKLAISCDNQNFIATAPLVLIFLADHRRWMDSYKFANAKCREPGLGDFLLAFEDAVVAAQNTVIAAESFGIGSCYIGDIMENKEYITDLLNLDKYTFPAAMLVYGYPTEQQKERLKPTRFNKKYIVMENSYKTLSEKEHREMFEEVKKTDKFDFDEYIQAFCKRKFDSDFAIEMSRSVKEYIKNFDNGIIK